MELPEIMVISIINWFFVILGLLTVLGILFFPILAIVFGVLEAKKDVLPGQKKSWKKTTIFVVLSVCSFVFMSFMLVLWAMAKMIIVNN